MRYISCAIVPVMLFLVATNSEASNASWGYVNSVFAASNGAIIFNTTGARTAPPACQNATVPQRFVLDASTVAGQAQVAVLLNAKIQNKQIYVYGAGGCTIWGDSETVTLIQIQD